MTLTGLIFLASMLYAFWYLLCRLRVNFTLSSVSLLLLIAFHGPAYWFYTRHWIYGGTFLNKLYDSSSGSSRPPDLGVNPAYDHLRRLLTDPAFNDSLAKLDIAMASLIGGIIVGFMFTDWVGGNNRARIHAAISNWESSELRPCLEQRWIALAFWLTIATCSIAMALLFIQSGKIHIVYQYFFSSGSEVEKIRWRREHGGFTYSWNLFFSTIAVFGSVYALVEMRFTKLFGWILASSFVMLVIFGKMAYLSKAPIVVYILQMCIAAIIMRSLKVSTLAVFGLAALLGCTTLAMVFIANSDIGDLVSAATFLFYRIFMIPNESLVEYFLAFPNYLPHTHGLDNRFIAYFLGEPKLLESYWRTAEVIRGVGGSTTTAMFIGDAWAQFAWAGVLVFPLALGCLLRSLDIFLVAKLGKTAASIAGLSLGYYGIFIALSTSLLTALLTGGLLMIPALVILGSLGLPRGQAETRGMGSWQ